MNKITNLLQKKQNKTKPVIDHKIKIYSYEKISVDRKYQSKNSITQTKDSGVFTHSIKTVRPAIGPCRVPFVLSLHSNILFL
jgi:hypothetical protein